jgi:hypothetical protein
LTLRVRNVEIRQITGESLDVEFATDSGHTQQAFEFRTECQLDVALRWVRVVQGLDA